jgi:metacaspase-1
MYKMVHKKALLVGINYKKTSGELRGCVNDINNMKDNLIKHFGYRPENIVLLHDEQSDTRFLPTCRNILNELAKVIMYAQRNNQLKEFWFHYSGHGSSILDWNVKDEADGRDEVIVPLDYQHSGYIPDDILHHYLSYLPKQCKCICFMDCCHSGTILDLKYKYDIQFRPSIDHKNSKTKNPIILISGCTDKQTSADAYINTTKKFEGAMTRSFLDIIGKYRYNITCRDLVENMQDYMKDKGYTQRPQITSSICLDNTSVFCSQQKPIVVVHSNI